MTLAPLVITPGTSASSPSDTVRVLTSTKTTFAAPVKATATHAAGDAYSSFVVLDGSSHGVKVDDTILAVPPNWSATTKCLLLTVKEDTSVTDTTLSRTRIPHVASPSASSWNATNSGDWPTGGFQPNTLIVNFGNPRRMDFSVSGDTFQVDTWTQDGIAGTEQLNSGIVLLKALYGRDTDGNGTVDVYDTTTPTDNAVVAQRAGGAPGDRGAQRPARARRGHDRRADLERGRLGRGHLRRLPRFARPRARQARRRAICRCRSAS